MIVIVTDPGCDDELHIAEAQGAAFAVMLGHRWSGVTHMDCGCRLWLEDSEEVEF